MDLPYLLSLDEISFSQVIQSPENNAINGDHANQVFVCANPLLAQQFHRLFFDTANESADSTKVMSRPAVYHWRNWAHLLLQQTQSANKIHKTALNSLQQRFLAQACLKNILNDFPKRLKTEFDLSFADEHGQLDVHLRHSNTEAIASSMIEHWQLCQQYDIDASTAIQHYSPDTALFAMFYHDYQHVLTQNDWFDQAQTEAQICKLIQSIDSDEVDNILPKQVYLAGFTLLSSAQIKLLQILRQKGCEIKRIRQLENIDSGDQAISFDVNAYHQLRDELDAVIQNMQQQQRRLPNTTMGVFVAGLSSIESKVALYLSEKLDDKNNDSEKIASLSWSIESAKALLQNKAISILPAWLNCLESSFDYAEFSKLLNSPFIFLQLKSANAKSIEDNLIERQLIDKLLREKINDKTSLNNIKFRLSKIELDLAILPFIIESIESLQQSLKEVNFASFAEACAWFSEQLNLFKWIGYADIYSLIETIQASENIKQPADLSSLKQLNSSANDALNALHQALDTISSLNYLSTYKEKASPIGKQINGKVGLNQFKSQFNKQLSIMASNAQGNAQLQFIDLENAAGLDFDTVWLMNLNHKTWPLKKKDYPFLAKSLIEQSTFQLADNHGISLYCQRIIHQVFKHYPKDKLNLSYHQVDSDSELECSPALTPYIANEVKHKPQEQSSSQSPYDNESYYQSYTSETAIDMHQTDNNLLNDEAYSIKIPGGVDAIKNQIACPFRAWAKNRLSLTSPESSLSVLQPKIHGIAIHEVLEEFWKKNKSHKNLCALYENNQIDNAIDDAIEEHLKKQKLDFFYDNFANIYKPTLAELLKNWLDYELQREDDFIVLEEEEIRSYVIGEGLFSFKIDRIDQRSDNSLLIIDYKSGSTDINKWKGENIAEPQLPIYLLMMQNEVEQKHPSSNIEIGIAYASLKTQSIGMDGIISDDDKFVKLNKQKYGQNGTEKDALIDHWKSTFNNASQAFIAAQHAVNPVKLACDYCDYASLCRINELSTDNLANDD